MHAIIRHRVSWWYRCIVGLSQLYHHPFAFCISLSVFSLKSLYLEFSVYKSIFYASWTMSLNIRKISNNALLVEWNSKYNPVPINMMEVQQTQIVFNNILIISSKFFFKSLHICQRQFLPNISSKYIGYQKLDLWGFISKIQVKSQ